jgi:AraC-like DNA-binding protein
MAQPSEPRRPVTDADRRLVAELHAEGLSRNEIARRIHRSGRTVSRIADELGLSFERGEQVQAATEARKVDARSRRARLALALLEDAERLRQQLFAACTVWNFGGKDNSFESQLIDEPSFRDKREIMSAIGIAIDRSVRLDEYDSGASVGQVVSLLESLAQGLTARWGSGDDEHPVDPEPGEDAA